MKAVPSENSIQPIYKINNLKTQHIYSTHSIFLLVRLCIANPSGYNNPARVQISHSPHFYRRDKNKSLAWLQGFFCEIWHWTGVDRARWEGIREDKITAHLQRSFILLYLLLLSTLFLLTFPLTHGSFHPVDLHSIFL